MVAAVLQLVRPVIAEFRRGIVAAIPDLLTAVLVIALAYVLIKIATTLLRSVLDRVYPSDEQLVVDFLVMVVWLFLWFGTVLAVLDVVGLGQIAASLGTATGFIALGVAYALSNMIADTVAGVYLLRDPDFNIGDRVTTASTTGTVTAIGLRKSRLELPDGDTVVLANSAVESRWTRTTGEDPGQEQ